MADELEEQVNQMQEQDQEFAELEAELARREKQEKLKLVKIVLTLENNIVIAQGVREYSREQLKGLFSIYRNYSIEKLNTKITQLEARLYNIQHPQPEVVVPRKTFCNKIGFGCTVSGKKRKRNSKKSRRGGKKLKRGGGKK
jgi:hypothetical protein